MTRRIARSGARRALTPSATTRRASMSRPESVSSRTASRGSRIAIWRISFRFFSPPENPSLSERWRNASSIWSSFMRFLTSERKSTASSSGCPARRRFALSAARRKVALDTPGISTGYWKPRKTPAHERSSGERGSRSVPPKTTDPAVTSNVSRPASTPASVLLPEPLGPMMAWTSPAGTASESPLRISLPPTRAWRPSMASSGAPPPSTLPDATLIRRSLRGSRRGASGPPRRTPSGAPGRPACRSR